MSTRDDLQRAYLECRRARGINAAQKILTDAFGSADLDGIPENQWPEAIQRLSGSGAFAMMGGDGHVSPEKAFSKWNATARGRGRGSHGEPA